MIREAGAEGVRQRDLEKKADTGKGGRASRQQKVTEFRDAIDALVKDGKVIRKATGTGPRRKANVLWAAEYVPAEGVES
jgi:hypothetical protein